MRLQAAKSFLPEWWHRSPPAAPAAGGHGPLAPTVIWRGAGQLGAAQPSSIPLAPPACFRLPSLLGNIQGFQAILGFRGSLPAEKGWESQPSPGLGPTKVDGEKSQDEGEEKGKVLLRHLPTPHIIRCQMGALIQLR